MLYVVKEEADELLLFFARKNGLKFKGSFTGSKGLEPWVRPALDWFIRRYLSLACVPCKARGWVYKVRLPKPYRSDMHLGRRQRLIENVEGICPECRARHLVRIEHIAHTHLGMPYPVELPFLVQV